MKIKWFIILGICFLAIGLGITVVALSSPDFNFKELQNQEFEEEEKTFEIDNISTITCKCFADNVKILPSDATTIKIIGKKGKSIHYEYALDEETKTLSIHQIDDGEKNFGIKFDFSPFGWTTSMDLSIFIPKSMLLDLNLDINAGNLTIKDLNFKTVNLDIDAGNATIDNVYSLNYDIQINAGNLTLKNGKADTIKCDISAGNATCKINVLNLGDFKVNCGNLTLTLIGSNTDYQINGKGTGNKKILTDVDLGSTSINYMNE